MQALEQTQESFYLSQHEHSEATQYHKLYNNKVSEIIYSYSTVRSGLCIQLTQTLHSFTVAPNLSFLPSSLVFPNCELC